MSIPAWFDPKAYFNNKLAATPGYNDLTLTAAFKAAGFEGDEGLWAHYQAHGASEGISPNAYFDVDQYMYAKAQEAFGTHEVTQNQIRSMYLAFENAGMTPWEHYQRHGWQEGLDPSNSFDTDLYLAAKLAKMQADEPDAGWTMDSLKQALATANLDPLTHYLEHGINEGLGNSFLGQGVVGKTQFLTAGDDSLFGTDGNDYFYAGLGYLSTNDYIDGGTGTGDTLEALLGKSPDEIAIRPTILNVEKIIFQAQTNSGGGGSNAVDPTGDRAVSVDAGAISGMTFLQNLNSRATLIVEDVRINSDLMTISWKNADAGLDVDYEVYFDNLTAKDAQQSGTLELKLMDVRNAQENGNPLTDQPFDSFSFNFTPTGGTSTVIKLQFRAEDAALYTGEAATYATLLQAFQNALTDFVAANPQYADTFEIALSGSFTATASTSATDSWSSDMGQLIEISTDAGVIDAPSNDRNVGWGVSNNTVPPTGGIAWGVEEASTETCPLIMTTIHLDNVGRVQWNDASDCLPDNAIFGSEAGDMIVGGMDDRSGIERFNVIVESGSWLSSLASTNNTLRMIEVQAGSTGQLFIGEQIAVDNLSGAQIDDLWGPSSWTAKALLLSTDGIQDVKLFDASALNGNANIGASITAASNAKYLVDVDGTNQIGANYAPLGAFEYKFGAQADILNMAVDSGVANDNDFVLNISMGGGNDLVNFAYTGALTNNQLVNMRAQAINGEHVTINGEAGNDTVWSWGNGVVTVNGGEGADAIYVGQNVEDQNAVWVYNIGGATADAANKVIYHDALNGAQPLNNDLLGDVAGFAYTGATANEVLRVTIDFKGFTTTVDIALNTGAGTVSATALNRAIIGAIEADAVLSKILVGKDGAGYSLIIESLIDGKMAAGDLDITFTQHVGSGGGTATIIGLTGAYVDDQFAHSGTLIATTENNLVNGGGAAASSFDVLFAITDMAVGDVLTFVIDGTSYTTAPLGAATLAGVATAIGSISFGGYTWTATATTGGVTLTTTSATSTVAAIPSVDLVINGDVADGTDTGTTSYNIVEGGAGNDVLVLNVNPDTLPDTSAGGTAQFVDVLKIAGNFGSDSVFNFDYTAAAGGDYIDGSAYGSIQAAHTAAVATSGTNSQLVWADVSTLFAGFTGGAATSGVFAVQIATTNTWQFFQVNNSADFGSITEGEVQTVGFITFDDATATAIAAGNGAGLFTA